MSAITRAYVLAAIAPLVAPLLSAELYSGTSPYPRDPCARGLEFLYPFGPSSGDITGSACDDCANPVPWPRQPFTYFAVNYSCVQAQARLWRLVSRIWSNCYLYSPTAGPFKSEATARYPSAPTSSYRTTRMHWLPRPLWSLRHCEGPVCSGVSQPHLYYPNRFNCSWVDVDMSSPIPPPDIQGYPQPNRLYMRAPATPSQADVNRLSSEAAAAFPGLSPAFMPTTVGVFTWFAVGRYRKRVDLLNTFQVM